MNKEEIKTYFETLAQDSNLEISNKIINKFVNLSLELLQDDVDSIQDVREEFLNIVPDNDNSDEWNDFIDEASTFIMDEILDDCCSTEEDE